MAAWNGFLQFNFILPMKYILMKEKFENELFTDSEVTVKSMKFASLEITSHGNIYPLKCFNIS